ncbi:MAG: hypothetical protein KF869_08210 [Phycisphaeraceae bacterium]|nr:hypothetical protein [Phycisphaeraceae bacterium]
MLLRLLNPARRRYRWPIKIAFLAAVLLLTCYPDPRLLVRHIRHWSDLSAMIEPDEPALGPIVGHVEFALACVPGSRDDPREALRIVEQVVYQHILYEWDWVTWGCADYLPTVAETIDKGREDCDGRAVVAASVLRRLGYEAHLVTDGSHLWVRTREGEAMAPMTTASGRTLISTSGEGTRVDPLAIFGAGGLLVDWPKNIAYGVAVFPIGRTAICAAAVLLVLLPRRPRVRWALVAASMFAGALWMWRAACWDPWDNSLWGAWAGLGLAASGVWVAARSGCGMRDCAGTSPNGVGKQPISPG